MCFEHTVLGKAEFRLKRSFVCEKIVLDKIDVCFEKIVFVGKTMFLRKYCFSKRLFSKRQVWRKKDRFGERQCFREEVLLKKNCVKKTAFCLKRTVVFQSVVLV